MKILLPNQVQFIIDEIKKQGFDAYAVGGCVRDALLNREPNDWDITTSAIPEVILDTFSNTIPTGLKHGTITVIIDNIDFEVTTYRIDNDYYDNRHPNSVTFTNNIYEDLSRRDFTINAMAYNEDKGIIDPFNGLGDLQKKIVCSVRNANERFNEDALRMIRAIRFSSQLNFKIDNDTFDAIKQNCHLIKNISIERIQDEFTKLLISQTPSTGIENLRVSGLLQYILPEVLSMVDFNQRNPHHNKDVYKHTLSVIDNTECDLILRLSALLHDIAKPVTFSLDEKGIGHFYNHVSKGVEMTENILKRLKYDNDTIKKVSHLVNFHMTRYEDLKDTKIKKMITTIGKDNLHTLFDLQIADINASAPPLDYSGINYLKEKSTKIINENQPLTLKDINYSGTDLIALGFKPSKNFGDILNYLLENVLEDPKLNNKKSLEQLALSYIDQLKKSDKNK